MRSPAPALLTGLGLVLALTACSSQNPAPDDGAATIDLAAPAAQMTCLREHGYTMLAAHRAGPADGYAENALSSLRRLAEMGVLYAEIDVRRSADGILFLLHDDTLDRTTTGTGPAETLDWATLAAYRLTDPRGLETGDTIPTLDQAVDLAREAGLVLNLDLKSVSPADIVAHLDSRNARDLVAVIAYSVDDTAALHRADPGMMVSAPNDIPALRDAGANTDALYVWMGVGAANAAEDARLAEQGLETSAGLFPLEDGTPAVYRAAASAGVELLSIDDVDTAVAALGGADQLRTQIATCAPQSEH